MARDAERPAWLGDQVANEAMDRYAAGDASAFPILYDAIAARIEGLVRRRTRDPSRIDDIVQQTFERIHRARGTFIRGSDVLSWAFKIARNLCIDHSRRAVHRDARSLDAPTRPDDESSSTLHDHLASPAERHNARRTSRCRRAPPCRGPP